MEKCDFFTGSLEIVCVMEENVEHLNVSVGFVSQERNFQT